MPGVAYKTKLKRIAKEEVVKAKARWKANKDKPFMESVREVLERLTVGEIVETAAILSLTGLLMQTVVPDTIVNIVGINKEDIKNEAAKITLSFVASYIIIHHAGALIGAGASVVTGVTDLVKWLIIGKALGTSTTATTFWATPTVGFPLVTLVPTSPPETWGDWFPKFRSAVGR